MRSGAAAHRRKLRAVDATLVVAEAAHEPGPFSALLLSVQGWAVWRFAFVAICLGSLAAVGGIYLLSLTHFLSVEGDNAIYVILSKALVTGHGYTNIQDPVPRIEAQYPPLFSVILMPIVAIWGTDGVEQMQALVACFALASMVLAFFLFRNWLGHGLLALAVTLGAAYSDLVWEFSHKVLTEIPYLFFTLLCCWWATAYGRQQKVVNWMGTLVALAASAAFLTRTIGMSLCVAVPVYLLLAPPLPRTVRSWGTRLGKVAYTGALMVVLGGGWTLRNRLVYSGTGHSYIGQFFLKQTYVPDAGRIAIVPTYLLGRTSDNIAYYATVYQRMLGGHIWDHVPLAARVSQLLLIATVLGFLYALVRRRSIAEFYMIGYVAIVLLWPWQDLRFAVPVLPFLVYYLAHSIMLALIPLASWRRLDVRAAAAMVLIPLALPTGIHTLHTAMRDREAGYHYEVERLGEWPAYPDWREFHTAAMWLKAHVPPSSTIIDRSPNILYLWTGLHARNYPYSYNERYVLQDIGHEGNDYVIVDSFAWTYTTQIYLVPVLHTFRDHFLGPLPIPGLKHTQVYRVASS